LKTAYEIPNIDEYWKRRESISTNSGITIETFKPVIPWQKQALLDIRTRFDYGIGLHEVLLTGSVGSAKSLFLAHLIISHCIIYSGACVGVFRMAFPDLRDTIFKDITDHLESENLKEGKHYKINRTRCQVSFSNGSSIVCKSFHDGKYTKVRSLRLSMAVFEEFVEFYGKHEQAVKEVRNRLGRLPHVKENLLIGATNPDDPSHWIYDYYIDGQKKHENRHVYYSLTFDNPFLPKSYIVGIMRDLDSKQVLRMIFGRWLELRSEIIYYEYGNHNKIDYDYEIDKTRPIHISFDFNIGIGKPLSCALFQVRDFGDKYAYDFFDEVVIEGMRTLDACEEIAEKGYLDNYGDSFFIHGDSAGSHNDTRSKKTDYDIIMGFFSNYQRKDGGKLNIIKRVPPANPPIRTRHNKVNSLCKNSLGEVMLFIYQKCKVLDKGLRLTKLKDKSALIEDDSNDYQHVTTALGYGVIAAEKFYNNEKELNESLRRRREYD
jgi:PBSX family phage terminase large subunit